MTAPGGFYHMHRGWMDNPELTSNDPFSKCMAWEWLIENAAFADHRQRIGSVVVELQRGQVAASIRYLGKAWRWDEKKVRRFLTRLKTASMIAAESAAGVKVVTICNYAIYQGDHAESAAPCAAETAAEAPQHRRKIEEGNNVKKESIDRSTVNSPTTLFEIDQQTPAEQDRFEQWWAMVPKKAGKGQARKAFKTALGKSSFDRLADGIRRYAQSVEGKDPTFTAHPATWLNGERWLDDLPDVEPETTATDIQADEAYQREYQAARAKGIDSPEFSAFLAKHRPPSQISEARR